MNDDGHVSNFVETEFLGFSSRHLFSFVQVRGSVPLFWEQVGLQVTQHKIDIARGMESTLPCCKKHFHDIMGRYGSIHILNLLGQRETSPEFQLRELYHTAVKTLSSELPKPLVYTEFDFNAIIKRDNYERVSTISF